MEILNKKQVDELFRREAVLIGLDDRVPKFRIASLFGAEAADYAETVHDCKYVYGYTIGDYDLSGISYTGFCLAATFSNVKLLQKQESKQTVIEFAAIANGYRAARKEERG